jgi:hypothetical protein
MFSNAAMWLHARRTGDLTPTHGAPRQTNVSAQPPGLRRCRRACWRLVMPMLAAVFVAAPASAHQLSANQAMQRAEKMAYNYADVGESYGAADCVRLNAHVDRCVIWSYLEETADTYGLYCDAYVNIRFVGRSSYRTRSRGWYDSVCDDQVTNQEASGQSESGTGDWKWIWDGPLTQWPQVVF